MKVITTEVFSFDELNEETKKNAIDNYISKNRCSIQEINSYCFSDDLHWLLEEDEALFTSPEFQYSLGYCQGDGLSFSFDLDIRDYLDKYFPNMKGSLMDIISNYTEFISKGNGGRYCYTSRNQVDLVLEWYNRGAYHNIEDSIEEVLEHIQDRYTELCDKYESIGYSRIYEWEEDESYVIEEIHNSDTEFLITGEIYN